MLARYTLLSLLALLAALVGLTALARLHAPLLAAPLAADPATVQPANPSLRQLDGPTTTFSNHTLITIHSQGQAAPYPSSITVAGLPGAVTHVAVRLLGVSHTYPRDIDVKLVAPDGRRVLLMSDAGPAQGAQPLIGAVFTFDDSGPPLPCEDDLVSGVYRPTNCQDNQGGDELPAPAPPSVTGDSLSHFIGLLPNGVWSLYVQDDMPDDGGAIEGGWELVLSVGCPPTVVSGEVRLQARTDHSGVQVGPVTTGPDGRFEFTLDQPVPYTVRAFHPRYLPAQFTLYDVCGPVTLPTVLLLGGDTDSDGRIGIADLVRLGSNYGTDPAADPLADIDGNGRVDIADLTMVGSNYSLEESPWTSPAQVGGQVGGGQGQR